MSMYQKILCYGDSNTYGYDPRFYFGGQYPENVRWTVLLERHGWQVFNRGENGRSIPQRKWDVDAAIQTIKSLRPDIVTIDGVHFSEKGHLTFAKRLHETLAELSGGVA